MKFILKTQKKRSAVSPVIATLLLIAIAVAAAIIVYAFVTGLIGGLSSGSGSNLITATGTLTLPAGSGTGLLVLSITDNANSPITGIQVQYSGFESTLPTGLPNVAGVCIGQQIGGVISCDGTAGSTLGACGANTEAGITAATLVSVPFCNATPAIISTTVPLPVGSESSATDNVVSSSATPLTTGTTYAATIVVDFANGSTHTQALSVTAEL